MRAIRLIIRKKMKYKKVQTALVGIILAIASLLLAASINLLVSLDKPYKETHNNLNGFDNLILAKTNAEDVDKIIDVYNNNDNVKDIQKQHGFYNDDNALVDGKKMKQFYIMEEYSQDSDIDKIQVLKGSDASEPGDREVWISSDVADSNDIKIGDYITFNIEDKEYKYEVSALIVDPSMGQAGCGVCRMWVKDGSLEDVVSEGNLYNVVTLTYKDEDKAESTELDVENDFGRPVNGYSYRYDTLKSNSLISYKMMGGILLGISGSIIFFVLMVIIMTIINTIYNEYKNIGIFESLGLKKNQVSGIYILQFLIIGFISSVVGGLLGCVVSKELLQAYFLSLGFVKVSIPIVSTILISIGTIEVFIALATYIATRKVSKISPTEAIRMSKVKNVNKTKKGLPIDKFRHLGVTWILGLKNIFANAGQSILLIIIMAVSIFIIVFSINAKFAMGNMEKYSQQWGLENCDISLEPKETMNSEEAKKIADKIANDSRIDSATVMKSYRGIIVPKDDDNPSQPMLTLSYDKDLSDIGMSVIEGRLAENKEEVTISAVLAKKYNKDVGDNWTLYIGGKKVDMKIVGKYECAVNFGKILIIPSDTISEYDKTFADKAIKQISIIAKDSTEVDKIVSDYKDEYGDSFTVDGSNQFLKNAVKENFGPIDIVMNVIIISFILVACICIMNINTININSNMKELGIYKTLGFRKKQIQDIYLTRISILLAISIIIGVVSDLLSQNSIMAMTMKFVGINNFTLSNDVKFIVFSLIVFTLSIMLSVVLSCYNLSKLSAKDLVSE